MPILVGLLLAAWSHPVVGHAGPEEWVLSVPLRGAPGAPEFSQRHGELVLEVPGAQVERTLATTEEPDAPPEIVKVATYTDRGPERAVIRIGLRKGATLLPGGVSLEVGPRRLLMHIRRAFWRTKSAGLWPADAPVSRALPGKVRRSVEILPSSLSVGTLPTTTDNPWLPVETIMLFGAAVVGLGLNLARLSHRRLERRRQHQWEDGTPESSRVQPDPLAAMFYDMKFSISDH